MSNGDPYRHVTRGERLQITAGVWNRLIDLVRPSELAADGGASDLVSRQTGIVKVRNSSGSDQPRYAVLGITGPIITAAANLDEFKRQVTLDGVTPLASTHKGKFCVLLEPLQSGAIGKGQVAGAVQAQLTGADVGFAEIADGVATSLQADAAGSARVLWAEAGSGTRQALVLLGSGAAGGTGGSDPDATHTVRGYVSLANQYLGAGNKEMDGVQISQIYTSNVNFSPLWTVGPYGNTAPRSMFTTLDESQSPSWWFRTALVVTNGTLLTNPPNSGGTGSVTLDGPTGSITATGNVSANGSFICQGSGGVTGTNYASVNVKGGIVTGGTAGGGFSGDIGN